MTVIDPATLESIFDPYLLLRSVRDDHAAIIDFAIVAANQCACEGMGVDPAHVVGARLLPLLTEAERATVADRYRHVVEEREPLALDGVTIVYADHAEPARRFDVRAVPVGDGLSVSWREVTATWVEREELRRTRAELARSEERHRLIAETAVDFVIDVGPDMRIRWASPSLTAFVGWTPEEVVGRTPMELTSEAEADESRRHLHDAITGRAVTGRRSIRCKDGSHRWLHRTAHPITDADGRPDGVLVGFRDIQAEVEAEVAEEAAHEAVRASEERLRRILDGLLEPLIVLLPVRGQDGAIEDFVYEYANPAACTYNGVPLEAMVGRRLLEVLPELRGQGAVAAYSRVVETGEPWTADGYQYRRSPESQIQYADNRAFRLGGSLVLVWRDVTEQHRARIALRESEARYRLLADSAVDVVTLGTPDTTLTWVSPSVTTVLGWEPTALLGTRVVDMIHPDDRDAWRARAVTDPGTSAVTYEARFRQADGGHRWMSVATTAIVDESGTAIARTGIARDISAEHAAREALEASRAELAEAQRVAHVGSWSRELGVASFHWTDELFRILGLDPAPEPPSLSVQRQLFTPDSWALLSAAMECLRTRGMPFAVDADAVRPDGELRHLVVRCEPVRDVSGAIARTRGTIADVTELRAAELRIQELNEGLEQRVQERTAELETFTYTLSHDLRAPLRWINGFAAMLQRRDGDRLDETSRHYLDEIRNASDRMGRLFEELLAYSRMGSQTVRAEPVDWAPIVASLHGTFGPRIATTGATLEIVEPLVPVRADPMLLDRAVTNLVDNAITYARPGEPASVRLSATRTGTQVRIAIADHGIGIAVEHHERIFAPFVRLHDDALPGTGIGLALVARAVRLMGSEMQLESTPGAGSTFWFDLPAG